MKYSKIQFAGFYALLGVFAIAVILMFVPYLKFLAFAAILAVLFNPVKVWIQQKVTSEVWSTIITLIAAMVIVIVPLYFIGQLLFGELISVYNNFQHTGTIIDTSAVIGHVPRSLQNILQNFNQTAAARISSLSANAFQSISNVLSNVFNVFISIFLVVFALYYFLKDGIFLKENFLHLAPLSKQQGNDLVKKLEGAINGVVKGAFFIALMQGVTETVGFLIFHVPQPFLWGSAVVIAALIPTAGSSLAVVPAVIFLFITGHSGAAIGLAIWASIAIGTIDNIISPRFIGSRVNLHPVLVLFSVLGGVEFFGIIGFLLGPIVTSICLTLFDVYRTDFRDQWE